jgi:hypothetical protein
VEAGPAVSRLALFAYASLASPASAAETLGRTVGRPLPARLEGFSRGWTLGRDNMNSEKTFARADGSLPRFCLGLNLEPADVGRPPNGALLELTEAELERLDLREMRYRRIEVTDAIVGDSSRDTSYDTIFAYTARAEHHHLAPPGDAIVIANYLRTVEAAFSALGPDQLEAFRATTGPPPVDVAEATLVRDRIPEGNPRAW